jgi:hypothetical protein
MIFAANHLSKNESPNDHYHGNAVNGFRRDSRLLADGNGVSYFWLRRQLNNNLYWYSRCFLQMGFEYQIVTPFFLLEVVVVFFAERSSIHYILNYQAKIMLPFMQGGQAYIYIQTRNPSIGESDKRVGTTHPPFSCGTSHLNTYLVK